MDVPQGQKISAPHEAKRNVGFTGRYRQKSSERTIQITNDDLQYRSFFQNFPNGTAP
ncbi:hypothetical protein Barb4_03840 [Bacteroidales bacterium Barb4]|nr:hypothetical protein Barb4_03840 [Bacteroidales bacterium Barb4]